MTNPVPTTTRTADLTRDFTWGQVPAQPEKPTVEAFAVAQPLPPLGPLAPIAGTTFRGKGFNTIFRPQNFAKSPTPLPVAPDRTSGKNPDDNILELNLTEEILEFSSPLGSVPNRGMVQGDIALNGVPYVQRINDVTVPGRTVGIHFEPGVLLNVPQTDDPTEPSTVVRMASIPHGTTIEAQGTSINAPQPKIDPVDITPFPVGNPTGRLVGVFSSQDADNNATFRIPQDLAPFKANGTITKEILADPTTVLRDRIAPQTITSTFVIFLDSDAANPLLGTPAVAGLVGGGTDNIAFLEGTGNGPNADAAEMSSIFWIETVAEQIKVPALLPGESVTVAGADSAGDGLVPGFTVTATAAVAEGTVLDVTYTQVQYTQLVHLNFNGLTWPHVSVATLIPADPVAISTP
ncbi:heme-binding protein [Actinomycetospora endophytica]|uniref:Heme-binding protein n=1 Tax=Actinomycetospora endophytica TaxID=2291215 RepID=A0ABS8PAG8_9PSEU|nr:heme-binding protein [Actinomycetospora endophytica]MCD2195255.1 heme-binding protein [Actinomycetospora endophytica]